MYVCGILQNWSLYPHTLMYCHGTWTQWSLGRVTHVASTDMGSSRGQWPLVQVFGKKCQCIHILRCIFISNVTMIAKVCDRESRRDTWSENRLVLNKFVWVLSLFFFYKKGMQLRISMSVGRSVWSCHDWQLGLQQHHTTSDDPGQGCKAHEGGIRPLIWFGRSIWF